jgi:hypothetical protein
MYLANESGILLRIWESLFQILARIPAVLAEGFRRFLQSLQENAGIVPKLGHDHFIPCTFQLVIH